jgi:hypothetical protein
MASGGASLDDGSANLESHTSVKATVVAFLNESLGLDVTPSDISVVLRLKAGPKDSTRPVVVLFTTRKI